MVVKINKPYRTDLTEEAWLEQRKKFITATEASALMGVNPYITPSKLLKEKPLPPQKLVSEFLDRGLENEETVLNRALEWLGADLMDSQGFYANPETRISATPDGITTDGRMIEVKCTGIRNLSRWEHPPLYYIMQCQVQMYVTGARENYLMARFFYNWPSKECEPGADKMWKITYSPEIMKKCIDKVSAFWYALEEGKTIRLKREESELHESMLRDTCEEFKGNVIMEKFEIDPKQLKIIRQTCLKAAAKMMPDPSTDTFGADTAQLAELIEKDIFYKIGKACNEGGRDFMIQVGAAVNGYVDRAKTQGTVEGMYDFTVKALKYINKA
jgi:putative phage-type endonuclease